jgi:hypothetical protein
LPYDLITYKTTIHLDNPKLLHIEWIYDIEIIRDGTYIYMIGEQTRDAGSMVAPWQITTGQIHVGDVPFDPTATDGTTLHIIYLGRRYMKGEKVRIETTETRLYPVVDAQGSAGIQSGRLPSPLLIEVHCPLNLAPTYERIEFEGNSVNAPPLLTDEIIRTSDEPMTFYIENSRPVTRYAIHWKWALPI